MTEQGWSWDPTLYADSAAYYAAGRVPYPPHLALTHRPVSTTCLPKVPLSRS